MPDVAGAVQRFLEQMQTEQTPSLQQIIQSMDAVAWLLVILMAGALVVGVVLTVSTRRSFLKPDEVESSPTVLLARVKQDPTRLPPLSIISRLGAESTLELLEYGDQIRTHEWRYRWSSVREELLRLLSRQNAFGPTYASPAIIAVLTSRSLKRCVFVERRSSTSWACCVTSNRMPMAALPNCACAPTPPKLRAIWGLQAKRSGCYQMNPRRRSKGL